jgi:hypothetical protein
LPLILRAVCKTTSAYERQGWLRQGKPLCAAAVQEPVVLRASIGVETGSAWRVDVTRMVLDLLTLACDEAINT